MRLIRLFLHRAFLKDSISALKKYITRHHELATNICYIYFDMLVAYKEQDSDPTGAVTAIVDYNLEGFSAEDLSGTTRRKDLVELCLEFSLRLIYTRPLSFEAQLLLTRLESIGIPLAINPYKENALQEWEAAQALAKAA